MNVKQSNSPNNLQIRWNCERRAFGDATGKVDAILTGYVIQYHSLWDAVQATQSFAKSEVHVYLTLSFLEVNNAGWYEATMSGTGYSSNTCRGKMAVRSVNAFDGVVFITC